MRLPARSLIDDQLQATPDGLLPHFIHPTWDGQDTAGDRAKKHPRELED